MNKFAHLIGISSSGRETTEETDFSQLNVSVPEVAPIGEPGKEVLIAALDVINRAEARVENVPQASVPRGEYGPAA